MDFDSSSILDNEVLLPSSKALAVNCDKRWLKVIYIRHKNKMTHKARSKKFIFEPSPPLPWIWDKTEKKRGLGELLGDCNIMDTLEGCIIL